MFLTLKLKSLQKKMFVITYLIRKKLNLKKIFYFFQISKDF